MHTVLEHFKVTLCRVLRCVLSFHNIYFVEFVNSLFAMAFMQFAIFIDKKFL